MKIYHFTKVPLERSSRICSQYNLLSGNSIIIDNNLFNNLIKLKGQTIIFHQQAMLFFLLYSLVVNIFYSKSDKNNIIYDMHDLIIFDYGGVIRFLRACLIASLEQFVMLFNFKVITVSCGLANVVKEKYNKDALVVYNFPLNFITEFSKFKDNKNNILNKICYFGIIDEKRIPVDIFKRLSVTYAEKIDIFGYVSPASNFKVEGFDFLSYKGEFSPNNMNFLNNYNILLFATDKELNLNYKYCMPNKIFQAVAFNLDIYISDFYEEINLTFDECRVDDEIALKNNLIRLSSYKMKNRLDQLYLTSKENFLKVVG